jgi:pSer/pThr/pTyr-binding forkhead associated (FHA) protein
MTRGSVWLHYHERGGPNRSALLRVGSLIIIGRSSGSDIILPDPAISRSHAKVELRADGVWVEDLGSGNGTYLDGQRVTSHLWRPGQTLRLGEVQFQLRLEDSPAPEAEPPAVKPNRVTDELDTVPRVKREASGRGLRIAWHGKNPRDKELAVVVPTGNSLIVGRDPKSDIVLDAASVSRRHAKITTSADGARVRDLNSQNGLKIDGKQISDEQWKIGQVLEIGEFVFSLDVASEEGSYERALSARNLRKRNRKKIGTSVIEQLRVFISYSRRDMDVADKLAAALEKIGFEVIIDRRDLPYGEEWQRELADLVLRSDTVLFLVSAHSVASQWCKWELARVQELRKRLFPLAIGMVTIDSLPEEIRKVHILPPEGLFDLGEHLPELVQALNTDRAWIKEHVRLADWALEWRTRGKPAAMLLRGAALEAGEIWKNQRPRGETPAEVVLELLEASRRGRLRRLRNWAAGSVALLAGAVLLAGWMNLGPLSAMRESAGKEREQREAAEQQRQVALEQAQRERQQREAADRLRLAALDQERREREQREAAERERQAAVEQERSAREQREAAERDRQFREELRRTRSFERWQKSPDGSFRWWIRNGTARKLRLLFASTDRENYFWPGVNTSWVLRPGQRFPYVLNCKLGEKICYGAFDEEGAKHWGVGRSGKERCTACCGTCGAGDLSKNLVE